MSDAEKTAMESDAARVRAAVDALSEHFETVQIFCTRHESGTLDGTAHFKCGSGNWFARMGQVRNWLQQEEEVTRLKAKEDHEAET